MTRIGAGSSKDTDTRTSTFETGFQYEHEGVWSAGGTTSFSKNGSSESINPVEPAGHYRHHLYRADMMFSRFRMDCGGRTGYALQADDVDRRHAHRTGWHHGLQDAVQGRGARRFYLAREDGSSQSFSGAFSILGFSGGATSVNSNAVRHAWFNRDTRTRHLCGVSDFPSKSSRVVSLPI